MEKRMSLIGACPISDKQRQIGVIRAAFTFTFTPRRISSKNTLPENRVNALTIHTTPPPPRERCTKAYPSGSINS